MLNRLRPLMAIALAIGPADASASEQKIQAEILPPAKC
jgi:hypothetical protein